MYICAYLCTYAFVANEKVKYYWTKMRRSLLTFSTVTESNTKYLLVELIYEWKKLERTEKSTDLEKRKYRYENGVEQEWNISNNCTSFLHHGLKKKKRQIDISTCICISISLSIIYTCVCAYVYMYAHMYIWFRSLDRYRTYFLSFFKHFHWKSISYLLISFTGQKKKRGEIERKRNKT